MRIVSDFSDTQIAAVMKACRKEKISRAEALRQAVDFWLKQRRRKELINKGAGLWKGKLKVDALEYQRVVREGGSIADLFNE